MLRIGVLNTKNGGRRPPLLPRKRGRKLILIVRQDRQRMKLDPLLVQRLGLVGRGFAVDRAVLGLAVMDLARLFGEFWADVVGVLGDVVAQFLELLPQLALLRRHDGDGRLRLRRWRRGRRRRW